MTESNENQTADASHLNAEKILSYRAGELSAQEQGRVQQHLLDCEDCIDLMLLAGDDPPHDEGSSVVDFEKEWIWTQIQSAKGGQATPESQRGPGPSRTTASPIDRTRRVERYGLLAATLIICMLGVLNFRQSGLITDLTAPQLNVAIHDFVSQDPRRSPSGPDAEVTEILISKEAKYYTIVFTLDPEESATYRVEILESNESSVWSQDGLEVDAFGFATLGLSRHYLKEGTYRIRILKEMAGVEVVEDYPLEIRFL